MSNRLIDYYVGLLRGYLLAHNAPQQILHALEELLADYRSKAGAIIGDERVEAESKPTAILIRTNGEPPKARKVWGERDKEQLRMVFATMPVAKLEEKFECDITKIRAMAYSMGLKRSNDAFPAREYESTVKPDA